MIFDLFWVLWILIGFLFTIHGIYSGLSFLSINRKLNRRTWKHPRRKADAPICLIIPLYKEDTESVSKTFTSLAEQDYPPELVKTLIVVEQGDESSLDAAEEKLDILKEAGFNTEIIVKPPPRSTKASAMNFAVAQASEPIIGIYDGGDVVNDRLQFRRAVSLLTSGYDGVGMRVIRGGSAVVSTFSWIDTTMWCDVTLPALACLLRTPLASGEGLFVRRDAVEAIGGFPDSLTEDSQLSLLFAQCGLKMALLDSDVYEGAPSDLNGLIGQKLRWHKGIFFCLQQTLISKLPIRRKLELAIAYSAPFVLIAIAVSFPMMVLGAIYPQVIPSYIFLWSIIVTVSTLTAPIYMARARYSITLKSSLLLPLYWFSVGVLTVYAFFSPKVPWYKTMRRSDFTPT